MAKLPIWFWFNAVLSAASLLALVQGMLSPSPSPWTWIWLGFLVVTVLALGYGLGRTAEAHPAWWLRGRKIDLGPNVGKVRTIDILSEFRSSIEHATNGIEAKDVAWNARMNRLGVKITAGETLTPSDAGKATEAARTAVELEFDMMVHSSVGILRVVNEAYNSSRHYGRGESWPLIVTLLRE